MNKIRIIDLLNKIANGEEVPKCFKVNNHTWEWSVNSYQNELHSEFAVTGLRYNLSNLNDEVEIIEEDKKIVKLKKDNFGNNKDLDEVDSDIYFVVDKINELIDYINNGD